MDEGGGGKERVSAVRTKNGTDKKVFPPPHIQSFPPRHLCQSPSKKALMHTPYLRILTNYCSLAYICGKRANRRFSSSSTMNVLDVRHDSAAAKGEREEHASKDPSLARSPPLLSLTSTLGLLTPPPPPPFHLLPLLRGRKQLRRLSVREEFDAT